MTRSERTRWVIGGLVLAAILVATAVVWWLRGREVASVVVGVGSLLAAIVGLVPLLAGRSAPAAGAPPESVTVIRAGLFGRVRRVLVRAASGSRNEVSAGAGGIVEDTGVENQSAPPRQIGPTGQLAPAPTEPAALVGTPAPAPQDGGTVQPSQPGRPVAATAPTASAAVSPAGPVRGRLVPAVDGGARTPPGAGGIPSGVGLEARVVDGMVSRDVQLDRILEKIHSGETGIFAVLGGHGMGKSAFLRQLHDRVARDAPDVLRLPAEGAMLVDKYGLSESLSGQYGEGLTPTAAGLLLERSSNLLGNLVNDLLPEFGLAGPGGGNRRFERFVLAIAAAKTAGDRPVQVKNELSAFGFGRMTDTRIDVTLTETAAAIVDRARKAQWRIDEAFIADWQAWLNGRRAVVILDGFETLIDDAVGQWLVGLAWRLPNTLVVVPLIPRDYAEHVRSLVDPNRSEELPLLSTGEVWEYLRHHLGGGATTELAQAVYDFTGGHPSAVGLVHRLIQERGAEARQADQLRGMLARLSADGGLNVAGLVEAILGRRRRALLRAVEVAALLNSFDPPLLQRLLETDAEPDGGPGGAERAASDASSVIAEFQRLGLLDRVTDGTRFRVHEFIRPALAARMARLYPQRWTPIHRAAAAHYFELITEFEDKTDKAYGSWYKYEDPLWQAYETEWLYHCAQLPDERYLTRTRFVLIFMEAFWWWGLYVDFRFCHHLLESWESAAQDDDDRKLLRQLHRFQLNYLPGPDKPAGPHWTEVRRALRAVREVCGLRGGWRDPRLPADVQESQFRTSLYLRLFDAHALWYDGRPEQAAEEYRKLEPDFLELGDDVMTAWFYYEWGDIGLSAGDPGTAATRVGQALRLAGEMADGPEGEVDSELLANLHRCLGDLCWPRDPVTAATEYGLAVRHAFLFQRTDNALDRSVNAPDEYTQRFYQEITDRATARARESADRPDRDEIMAALVAPTGGAAPGDLRSAVLAGLFPRNALDAELHLRESEFADYWGDVVEGWDLDIPAELERAITLADQIGPEQPPG
ncbi:ATP-binding protein [Plantactinospora sp. BB1]|uniref:ATP-binding protein n=1 Tax=Plantactinospora sp. BB1 TaxID=2071627 RepID=UPI00131F1260|nr:hypothetical protein [Plantactinospora sp. BB1]